MKTFNQRVYSTRDELIPRNDLRIRGLELRSTTAADFGYPEGLDLFECLWYAVRNAVLNAEREARGMRVAS